MDPRKPTITKHEDNKLPLDDLEDGIEKDWKELANMKTFYDDISKDLTYKDHTKSKESDTLSDDVWSREEGSTAEKEDHNNMNESKDIGDPLSLIIDNRPEHEDSKTQLSNHKSGYIPEEVPSESDAKQDVHAYMDFIKAKKIIEKNKWDLTHPRLQKNTIHEPSIDVHLNKHPSKTNEETLLKQSDSLNGKQESPTETTNTKNMKKIDKHDNKNRPTMDEDTKPKQREETFRKLLKNLQSQLSSLKVISNTTDGVNLSPQQQTFKDSKHSQTNPRNNSDKLQTPSEVESVSRRVQLDVTGTSQKKSRHRSRKRQGELNSEILDSGGDILPQPDPDEYLYDTATIELEQPVDHSNHLNNNNSLHGNGTYHVIDEGIDKVDIDTGGNSWTNRIHGDASLVAAGSVVMGLGILLVAGYVLYTCVKRRQLRRTEYRRYSRLGKQRRSKDYRRLDQERESLLHQNNDYSLFGSDTDGTESEEEGNHNFDSRKAPREENHSQDSHKIGGREGNHNFDSRKLDSLGRDEEVGYTNDVSVLAEDTEDSDT